MITQLKEANRLGGAKWSAILERCGERWELYACPGLLRNQQASLRGFLQNPEVMIWISGAISFGRHRWRTLPPDLCQQNGERLYLFPTHGVQAAVLVCTNELDRDGSSFWRILTLGISALMKERSEGKLAKEEADSSAKQIELVRMLIEADRGLGDVDEAARQCARNLATYFTAGCVEIAIERRSGWYAVSEETTTCSDEDAGPGNQDVVHHEVDCKPYSLPLSWGSKKFGFLRLQISAKHAEGIQQRRVAEIAAEVISTLLYAAIQEQAALEKP